MRQIAAAVTLLLAAGGGEGDVAPLGAALEAGRWLRSRSSDWGGIDLYAGSPGPVLFFLEAARATGGAADLAAARARADALLTSFDASGAGADPGLYTGLAGAGATLLVAHRVTGETAYRDGARRAVEALAKAAQPDESGGVRWNETTDVIAGSAGIGLFLIEAARELGDPKALELAAKAGTSLVRRARKAEGGLEWAMDPTYPVVMPNFSHGTAGVAYFLATLFEATKREEFLAAAIAGGNHLLAIAETRDGGCRIRHHAPGGETLHYLGFCHGPPGAARLFERLARATGDASWREWVLRGARSVVLRGENEPGLWNNVGLCCGTAGIGDFYLDLWRATGETVWLERARAVAKDVIARGQTHESGLSWRHAEHRARPEELSTQTGLMQGASGIGLFLLRLDAAEKRREPAVRLPDTPYR